MKKTIITPFKVHDPVKPPIFTGRYEELGFINEAIMLDRENLIIHGADGIGKSSVLTTIFHQLKNSKDKVLTVEVNATDIINGFESNFLSFITHKICQSIWIELMGNRYSELLEDVLLNSRGRFSDKLNPEERALKRIFKIVTSSKINSIGKTNNELGAGGAFVFSGKATSTNEIGYERKPLETFEFLALLKELNDIIKEFGYQRIIVFCDELNHLPDKVNIEIIRNYFRIFTSNDIQFLIVAINPKRSVNEYEFDFTEAFNYQLEVNTFESENLVEELIKNCLKIGDKYNVSFADESYSILFNKFNGHPWWIQKASDYSYKKAVEKNLKTVIGDYIFDAYEFLQKDYEFYLQLTSEGKPFRKKYFKYSI